MILSVYVWPACAEAGTVTVTTPSVFVPVIGGPKLDSQATLITLGL